MSAYDDYNDYKRECGDFDRERFSDHPAFNEDFMVAKPTQFDAGSLIRHASRAGGPPGILGVKAAVTIPPE